MLYHIRHMEGRRRSPRVKARPPRLWIGDPDPEARFVVLDGRYAIPPRFQAAAWPDEIEGVRVDLLIEVDEQGAPSCRGLTLEPLEEDGHITTDMLRKVKVDALMRSAITEAMRPAGDLGREETATSANRDAFYERYRRGARRPRRGSPVTDQNLRQVADLYRAAFRRGDPPTQTVADEMHIARSTAARWVAQARERDLLGPAMQGKAGEAS